jgi:predicted MFS family arabinose efflux permease
MGGVLTVAFGWRADWWALVPLALLAGAGILRFVPATVHGEDTSHPVLNRMVVGASLVAALTFAVMIGSFYLAEQYLQRAAGFSALGASAVLVVVALLVGAAAPIAGRLVDQHGERVPAIAGFLAAALGLLVLAIPGVPLHSAVTILPLVPIGLGLGMLFVPTSRAALNATPLSSHGRTSALLSVGRLLGAAVGAGLAGVALGTGVNDSTVHTTLLVACAACLILGVPAAARLGAAPAHRTVVSEG